MKAIEGYRLIEPQDLFWRPLQLDAYSERRLFGTDR